MAYLIGVVATLDQTLVSRLGLGYAGEVAETNPVLCIASLPCQSPSLLACLVP